MKLFSYQYYRSRIPGLDYLRGVAILMVLLSHYPVIGPFTHLWVGVDLFFVLSGYLVAGVLMKDIGQHQKLRFKRFFIRRGLKIYPSFYTFLLITISVTFALRMTGIHFFSIQLTWQRILAEVFYIQNLVDGVWLHTWSLAVEEQFYLFLPIVLYFLLKSKQWVKNLFRLMVLFIVTITVLRFFECDYGVVEYKHTHLIDFYFRLDALFLGVTAACAERLFPKKLERVPNSFWITGTVLGIVVVVLFSVNLSVISCHMARAGYTFVNLSFFFWVLSVVVLHRKKYSGFKFLKPLLFFKPVASIGLYSYNIYLWHAFVIDVLFAVIYATAKANILFPYAWRYLALYLVVSVLVGYLATRFFEVPILKWRDKKYQ